MPAMIPLTVSAVTGCAELDSSKTRRISSWKCAAARSRWGTAAAPRVSDSTVTSDAAACSSAITVSSVVTPAVIRSRRSPGRSKASSTRRPTSRAM